MERVLILGSSGFVGSNLVAQLQRNGHPLRLASRTPALLNRSAWQQHQRVQADLLVPSTLPAALADIDVVYCLVHGMTEGRDYQRREADGARNLAAAAADAGVKRIIYLGAVCPDGAQSTHLSSRTETGEILRQGRVPVVELRAPVIIGPGSAAFEVMRDLVSNLPLMITPRWVRSKMAPIALDDLLFYLQLLAQTDECDGQILNACGPQVLSYEQMMQRLANKLGKSIKIIQVPLLSPDLSSHWLRFITSVPDGIAKALIGGLKQDLLVDDLPLRQRFPKRLLSFDEAISVALTQEQGNLLAQDPSLSALLKRRWQPNFAFYPKTEQATVLIDATPQQVWQQLCQIGAKPRYFALDPLWRIRELMDAMIGGEGRNYYRRDPFHLQLGDRIDSWRVAECDEPTKLTLHFGMKAPGMGGLTFTLRPQQQQTELTVKCWWHPAGAPGLLYWWAMLPAHAVIFQMMGDKIRRLSEDSAVVSVT